MRCEDAENHIAEYLDGTLPLESPLRDHLAVCARCRANVQELQSTWSDLGLMPAPKTSPVMGPALQAAIAETRMEFNQPINAGDPELVGEAAELPVWRRPMPYLLKPALFILMSIGAALFLGHSLVETTRGPAIKTELPALPALPALNDNEGHFRGPATASLTLVEYGDYACPSCATYNDVINGALKEFPNTLRLEYRHYPLIPIHPNAMAAAVAAEAAGEQGHYWEMHDLLFSSQQRWAHAANPQEEFKTLAASIGLNADRFARDLQSDELHRRVTNDESNGREALVNATPTFFLNGKVVSAPPSLEAFRKLIRSLLDKN